MHQDAPIPRQDSRSDDLAVIEWGADEPDRAGRRDLLAGITRNRRLPLVPAVLAGVGALASLMGEWVVMTVPNAGPQGDAALRVPGGVADIGGYGVAYLVGLLVVAGSVALALGGTPAVRHNARVVGLALTGTVLALLVGALLSLEQSAERMFFYQPDDGFQVEYGRGLATAFAAVLLFGLALLVTRTAGRFAATGTAEPGNTGTPDDTDPGDNGAYQAEQVDDRPRAPVDLTVRPTVPFARPEPEPPSGR